MPLVACVMGAIAMFAMAVEDGERPIETAFTLPLPGRRRLAVDHRHLLLAICGGGGVVPAVSCALPLTGSPPAPGAPLPQPRRAPAGPLVGLAATPPPSPP